MFNAATDLTLSQEFYKDSSTTQEIHFILSQLANEYKRIPILEDKNEELLYKHSKWNIVGGFEESHEYLLCRIMDGKTCDMCGIELNIINYSNKTCLCDKCNDTLEREFRIIDEVDELLQDNELKSITI